jgi:hypothetical protein
MTKDVLRIGGAAGFWGDSALAVPQLLTYPDLDYLVFDYLAETTMAILQRARMKNPSLGYATDFVIAVIKPHLGECMKRGIRLIANAGGLNPLGCRDAILAAAKEIGCSPKVAVVLGDDQLAAIDALRGNGVREMQQGTPIPSKVLSANAYLGAQPIAAALAAGADIVVTGRCVDSAVTLGAAAHEFKWSWQDWDKLAQASLAGHLLECGPQATGGLYTDWEDVPNWANIGYPVVEMRADGTFDLTKPAGTGGLVCVGAVAEQMVYEIGDPAGYMLPDVVCDFRSVHMESVGSDRVHVSGAVGRPPSRKYKVSATWQDGYQINIVGAIRGIRARAKAQKTADALIERSRTLMAQAGVGDYSDIRVEMLGCESHYGPHAKVTDQREIVLRIAARHTEARGLGFLQKEVASAGTSMGPGTRGHFGGRADIQPVVKLFSFLIEKSAVPVEVQCGDFVQKFAVAAECGSEIEPAEVPVVPAVGSIPGEELVEVPLVSIALARSGDKGNDENIGVIARDERYLPWLRAELTAERVHEYFAHLVEGPVERFDLPGINAMNFLMHSALGGGGTASLSSDPLGKAYAQMLLDMPVHIPRRLLEGKAQ